MFFVLKRLPSRMLAYHKGKVTSAVVLYTISAELTGEKATKQDAGLPYFIVP
jgi:hypothetical protein